MSIIKQASPVQSTSAKKFFASPSKLSSGEKSRRFQGTVKSETIMTRASKSPDSKYVPKEV